MSSAMEITPVNFEVNNEGFNGWVDTNNTVSDNTSSDNSTTTISNEEDAIVPIIQENDEDISLLYNVDPGRNTRIYDIIERCCYYCANASE